MSTDNPTHAELVKKAQSELSLFQRIGKQTSSDLLVCVLSLTAFIESQASRIEELEADNKRLREALRLQIPAHRDRAGDCWCLNGRDPAYGHTSECLAARAALGGKP